MATKLAWTDQPKVLEQANILFSAHIGGEDRRLVEVRNNGETFYVTQGNLFGSQTLKCDDIFAAFRAMQLIANPPKKPVPAPEGCTLMEERT